MTVYLTKMAGSCYEDYWENDTGIFSTMELALAEFERAKKLYKIGEKQLKTKWNNETWTDEMMFNFHHQEWDRFIINEYELNGDFKKQHFWKLEKGEWHELNN